LLAGMLFHYVNYFPYLGGIIIHEMYFVNKNFLPNKNRLLR